MMEKNLLVEENYDSMIEDALRTAPMAAPPPLLYASIMQRVRRTAPYAPPRFRLAWLDLALSLFFAGMVAVVWFALQSIPPVWISYLRNQAMWNLQKIYYLDAGLVLWLAVGVGLSILAACMAVAIAGNTLKGFRDF